MTEPLGGAMTPEGTYPLTPSIALSCAKFCRREWLMYRIQAYFAIGGIAFLLSSPLQTQTQQTNATTFTSSTELVLIPTVVNDKFGAHISGLTKEEFALKQDGKSRRIAVFEEVKTNSARVRRSEGEHGTFSNFDPGESDYHRLNII